MFENMHKAQLNHIANQLWTADRYGDQRTSINVDPKTFKIVE